MPRKATKSLSIARLPPVLLIHLKRFTTTNGVFWDKSETPVIFPTKHLDLTRYIPPSPAQIEGKNPSGPANPTSTTGPFLYDLFAISNHMGSLSNGHCRSTRRTWETLLITCRYRLCQLLQGLEVL